MGSSLTRDESILKGNGLESCLYSLNCEESCVKHGQCTSDGTKKTVKAVFWEEHHVSSSSEEDDDSKYSIVQELGTSLGGILHCHDALEPLGSKNSEKDESCNQKETKPISLDTDMLTKCVMFLGLETVQSQPSTIDAGGELSCRTAQNENCSRTGISDARPLPTPLKLVSALKGSRAQHGKPPSGKLTVKWAPDVYDPPVTSSSHTVKSPHHHHRHRSKTKKDHNKHKNVKGKSSRGSVSEKKHAHRSSTGSYLVDPRILRLQALESSKRSLLNRSGQPKVEPLEFSVRSQEIMKCGSSCYVGSLAPVRLSVAEAS